MQTSNTDSLVLCFGLNGDQHAWNLMKEHLVSWQEAWAQTTTV